MESLINPSHESHASSLDSLKPSVLVIILILLMTLLISLSICFLLRCLNRCSSHRSIIPESSFSSDSFRFSNHRVSPETERTGTSSVLDSLPIFKFSSVTRRSNNNNNDKSSDSNDCAVCLSKFEPEDQLRLLPRCCHAFHKDCIDVWLLSNQTCPLCRSPLFASESDIIKSGERDNSFRLEIGSISRRGRGGDVLEEASDVVQNRSYSIGSFDYIVDDVESEISESNLNRKRDEIAIRETAVAVESSLAAEIGNNNEGGGSRSWLKEYVDRISSRAMSFRSSGRFVTGSSRRSEEVTVVDLEANQAGEEISEIFRWLSGV